MLVHGSVAHSEPAEEIMPESCPSHCRAWEYFAVLCHVLFREVIGTKRKQAGKKCRSTDLKSAGAKSPVGVRFPLPAPLLSLSELITGGVRSFHRHALFLSR